MLFVLGLSPTVEAKFSSRSPRWKSTLRKRLSRLDARYQGKLGIYVKDLSSGEEISFHGEEVWYLASGVKLPVALRLLKDVDEGKLSLNESVTLASEDYVDGAGETNQHPPGTRLTLRYLLEQMLIHSDNTASDLLIRRVGIDRINQSLQQWVPGGFSRVTSLSEVRRLAYSGIHEGAHRLTSPDLLRIKMAENEEAKLTTLAHALDVPVSEFRTRSLDTAFAEYYSRQLNSSDLKAYGRLLELVTRGRILSDSGTELLLGILGRVETGKQRIRAGLPSQIAFAHKTGTQHRRLCDFGIAWGPDRRKVVIAACARDFSTPGDAELAFKEVGKALGDSGLFNKRG